MLFSDSLLKQNQFYELSDRRQTNDANSASLAGKTKPSSPVDYDNSAKRHKESSPGVRSTEPNSQAIDCSISMSGVDSTADSNGIINI